MKKTATITFHAAHNYGSNLQAFALQQILLSFGCKNEIINLRTLRQKDAYNVFTKRRGLKYILKNLSHLFYYKSLKKAHQRFEDFINNKLRLTQEFKSCDELSQADFDFDYYIAGSDQIWNPIPSDFDWAYYLTFVRKGKKISYAPSFGQLASVGDETTTKRIASELVNFDAISVREQGAAENVRNLIGLNPKIVLDPTLLLSSKDYEYLCEQIPRNAESPFIAAYILDRNKIIDDTLEEISNSIGMAVRIFEADAKSELSVEEWIAVYRDASYVITDSFHGTVFSIIFNKPFVCLGNANRGNTRFDSLLGILDLQNRYLAEYSNATNLLSQPIVWSQVNAILEVKRGESFRFLL